MPTGGAPGMDAYFNPTLIRPTYTSCDCCRDCPCHRSSCRWGTFSQGGREKHFALGSQVGTYFAA